MAVTRITSRDILDLTIGNADIAEHAGIEPGKISLPEGHIIVGDENNEGQAVGVSGDASLASDGTLTIPEFAEDQHGLVPGPDANAIAEGYVLQADGSWVPKDGAAFADNEVPQPVPGQPSQFALAQAPVGSSLHLFKNGIRQTPGAEADFTWDGVTITFTGDNIPQEGDVLLADYRY